MLVGNLPVGNEIDGRVPVTVLSGFLGAGKTTLVNNILNRKNGLKIGMIVNDLNTINVDAELVKEMGKLNLLEPLIHLEDGCICCSLRDKLVKEINRLTSNSQLDYLIIEGSGISEPLPIAELLVSSELCEKVRLDTMVTVIDCYAFGNDIQSLVNVKNPTKNRSPCQSTIDDLTLSQLEFANIIVLNKIDLIDQNELNRILALISTMNPEALIVQSEYCNLPFRTFINTRRFCIEKAATSPGWLKIPRDRLVPEFQQYGIDSFVYRRDFRPFHPQRLWNATRSLRKRTSFLRSKGFIWSATRLQSYGVWNQAGTSFRIRYSSAADTPPSTIPTVVGSHSFSRLPIQELIFIGKDLDVRFIEDILDSCLLTDNEYSLGPIEWKKFPDPFSEWEESEQKRRFEFVGDQQTRSKRARRRSEVGTLPNQSNSTASGTDLTTLSVSAQVLNYQHLEW